MEKGIEGLLPLLTKGKLTLEKRKAVNIARAEKNARLIELFDKEAAIQAYNKTLIPLMKDITGLELQESIKNSTLKPSAHYAANSAIMTANG
jgi:hypothetical protein